MSGTGTSNGKKTALITGASGGIGLEFARIFARHGYNLALVARSKHKLNELAADLEKRHGISARTVHADLSLHSAPQQVFDELQASATGIDMLVNNAGYSVYGLFSETALKSELDMMQVNMFALTHLTKLFLPRMIENGFGRILNISSTAAFQPGPYMAVYYASKAYVLSFSEAIAEELRNTGVTVTALCPGPTRSGFQERANMHESRLMRGSFMDAHTVALAGYRGLMDGKAVVVPGRANRVAAASVRLMPRNLVRRLSRWASERVQ